MPTQKKKKRIWIWIVLALVVLLVIGLLWIRNAVQNASAMIYKTYTVASGSVETTVTGSGRLDSADSETLQLPGGVVVSSVPVKAGDSVKQGDVIAVLDRESLTYRAAQVSSDLSSLDRQIASRSRVSSVKSPARGRIKYLPVSDNDAVLSAISRYGALAILSTDELMQVTIESSAELPLYSEVNVRWDGGEADGTIASKTAAGYLVTLTDDDTPYQAQAEVYDGETLLGSGQIEIHSPVTVLAAGGRIEDVKVSENDLVSAGATLFSLDSDPNSASYAEALSDRADKAALYQTLLSYLNDPRVLAPADGILSDLSIEEGEAVADSVLASGLSDAVTFHTGGAVKMSIDVDELDIDSVALGQSAEITLDAYPEETFEAEVTHISYIGALDGSITTYPVEVTLHYDERLLEGMNGSAVVRTNKVENVLLIPIEAIFEDSAGEYVTIQSADGSFTRADITTGLSDGTYAEVTSGLAVGDVVSYPDTNVVTQLQTMMENRNATAEESGYPTVGGNGE